MAVAFLDFEQPIAELEAKIEELKHVGSDSELNIEDEIGRLQAKSRQLTVSIFASLTPWQITQLARHPHRPYTLDYVAAICSEFYELHGDRMYADDGAIIGGLGRIDERALMIIGHQKGRDTKERVRRNYGMPKPEGYRKALRLMRLAERFGLPLLTLIDTQGAYPGVGAEERGQSEAIARNLFEMSVLRIPIVTVVTGEGGSGGALGIGVCDRLMMLQYSTYSVISPEGCASILWKSQDKKEVAADSLNLTADRLHKLGLVDEILEETLGGAHRDPAASAASLKAAVVRYLNELTAIPADESLEAAERTVRYRLLGEALRDGETLLTAHHEDDQLETVLLQLLRGAGLAGIAAMPARAPLARGFLVRPLLASSRQELIAYLRARGLEWIEDPMNSELRLDRNYLRARVLPAIRERWPAAATTVTRTARHAAEAQRLLDELGRADVARAAFGARLSAKVLRALTPERRRNALRYWMTAAGYRPPPASRLEEIAGPVLAVRSDASPASAGRESWWCARRICC